MLETQGFEVAGVDIVFAEFNELEKHMEAVGLADPFTKIVGKAFTIPVPVATFLSDAPAETHAIFPESPFVLVFILT